MYKPVFYIQNLIKEYKMFIQEHQINFQYTILDYGYYISISNLVICTVGQYIQMQYYRQSTQYTVIKATEHSCMYCCVGPQSPCWPILYLETIMNVNSQHAQYTR